MNQISIANRKFFQQQQLEQTHAQAKAFEISSIFTYYATVRALFSAKRPWAHSTKTGSGRKHQQGKPLTKEQRSGNQS